MKTNNPRKEKILQTSEVAFLPPSPAQRNFRPVRRCDSLGTISEVRNDCDQEYLDQNKLWWECCDFVMFFRVKEVRIWSVNSWKVLIFLSSHTMKKTAHNRKLLQAVFGKKISDDLTSEVLRGRIRKPSLLLTLAGIVVRTIAFWKPMVKKLRSFDLKPLDWSYDWMSWTRANQSTNCPKKLAITNGRVARVAKGAAESFGKASNQTVSIEEFCVHYYESLFLWCWKPRIYNRRKSDGAYDRRVFMTTLNAIESHFKSFLKWLQILIAAAFGDPGCAAMLEKLLISPAGWFSDLPVIAIFLWWMVRTYDNSSLLRLLNPVWYWSSKQELHSSFW